MFLRLYAWKPCSCTRKLSFSFFKIFSSLTQSVESFIKNNSLVNESNLLDTNSTLFFRSKTSVLNYVGGSLADAWKSKTLIYTSHNIIFLFIWVDNGNGTEIFGNHYIFVSFRFCKFVPRFPCFHVFKIICGLLTSTFFT